MTATDILLERETANDESAIVVAIHVASGTAVEQDQVLFDIENSKATQEVEAPASGILIHALQIGDTVGFGVPLARIVPSANEAALLPLKAVAGPAAAAPAAPTLPPPQSPPPPNDHTPAPTDETPTTQHFSREAATLLAANSLSPTLFRSDFVTAKDVLAKLAGEQPPAPAPARPPGADAVRAAPPAGAVGTNRKRAEIESLSRGAGSTMLSVLGVDLGVVQVARPDGDVLADRITDLVLYESARLMRKYPRLNACYADDRVVPHQAVHAGIAIDGGGRLMVYGIENADRIDLHELSGIISEAVARYVENALTAAELTRATYTVTDLSEAELDFVFPLLPRGQSCILGITRSDRAGFRLFAGFDHRVTEGREVAMFLGELRDRIASFACRTATEQTSAHCAFCSQSLGDATSKGGSKGLLKVLDRAGHDSLCCASCWHGW